ncbi:energy transducer TonB [Tenacibaculum agarivorans]|uniref:energy transducer TonB n=1 Tax=Tenacibaculum agarivorans TaxID=1908389 RepID=UPI00094B83F1|nr:energy transducer TonB [Tenacibaculum agarivorans]
MKKLHWLLLCLLFLQQIVTSQSTKTCDSPSKVTTKTDLNGVDKCKSKYAGDDSTPSRYIVLGLNNTKRRFLRKRKKEIQRTKRIAESIDALSLSTKGISNEKQQANFKNELGTTKLSNHVYNFQQVDKLPSFQSCKNPEHKDRLRCFNLGIGDFIQEHFEYPEEALDKEIVGKVIVSFVIDKYGDVVNVKAVDENNNDQTSILTKYSEELVSKLSRIKPAEKNGQSVAVSYELHLDFSL